MLLPEGSTTKAKEAGNFAFLLTDVSIPDGMSHVGVVGYLADAGIYTTEDGMVYGMDGSDSPWTGGAEETAARKAKFACR